MDIKSFDAANAYGKALTSSTAPGVSGVQDKVGGGQGFGDMVNDVISGAVEATGNAEISAAEALNKQGDLIDVVTAVNNAEVTLQTVVAVRDKVIQAYNDIIKMPI